MKESLKSGFLEDVVQILDKRLYVKASPVIVAYSIAGLLFFGGGFLMDYFGDASVNALDRGISTFVHGDKVARNALYEEIRVAFRDKTALKMLWFDFLPCMAGLALLAKGVVLFHEVASRRAKLIFWTVPITILTIRVAIQEQTGLVRVFFMLTGVVIKPFAEVIVWALKILGFLFKLVTGYDFPPLV